MGTTQGEERCTVNGEYSEDDVLTFTPEAGFVGGDTVTLQWCIPRVARRRRS
jgi:hypothetical protein